MVICSQIGRPCYVTVCQQVGRGLAPRRDLVYPPDDGRDVVTWTWEVLPASGDRNRDGFSCYSLTEPSG